VHEPGEVGVSIASVVVSSSHGLDALRATLHSVWRASIGTELIVTTNRCDPDTAGYLVRQYRRGKVSSLAVAGIDSRGTHCDLDRTLHLATGTFVARVSDDVRLQAGWLDKALAVMEAIPTIGCLGLVDGAGRRRPGPRRRLGLGALQADSVDTHCFVTRRDLAALHCAMLTRGGAQDSCAYQAGLRQLGFHVAYLPGLAARIHRAAPRPTHSRARIDGDIPLHGVRTTHGERIRQAYELGQDVLLTCVSCGNGELEVLTAEIEFCARHDVAVGHTYTLRCGTCGRLQFEEDLQLACPADAAPLAQPR
jgi:hypothetical protein